MKVINKILNKYSLNDLLSKYSFKDAEKDIKKNLPLIKRVWEKYVTGMKNNDPAYRYPTYIFLFVMLALSLVELFPAIVRWATAVFTLLTSGIIAVLRK